jgi:hypothetical protein
MLTLSAITCDEFADEELYWFLDRDNRKTYIPFQLDTQSWGVAF